MMGPGKLPPYGSSLPAPPPTSTGFSPYVSQQQPQQPYGSQIPQQQQQQQPYGSQLQQQQPPPYGAQITAQQPYGTQQMQQPYNSAPYLQRPQTAPNPTPYSTAPAFGQTLNPPPQYGSIPPTPNPQMSQQFGGYPPQQQQPAFSSQQNYSQPYPPQQPFQQAGGPMMPGAMGMPGGMPGMSGGVVSLVKGGNMSLTKAVPNLRRVTVGVGWDVRQTPGAPFDLDASVFMLKGDGRVRMPQDLIFYNNRQSIEGAVYHHGDNLTGAGEGDDEQVSVDLTRVPPEIMKIVAVVSIYEAEMRGQNFGMVSRAYIRVVNADNSQEIVRFDLTEEASMFNCMVFGELYRYNNEWKFRAIGQGVQGGLKACGPMFGIAMQ